MVNVMINICFAGVTGWAAPPILAAIDEADDLTLTAMAARHLGHWEIIDYASDTKPDVPSGTARELAETLAQVREPARGSG